MSNWDAAKYHRLSDPQLAWARTVAVRLQPTRGERILDIGCGTGRLTAEIAATPGIVVVGPDRSSAMLIEALKGPRLPYVLGDGAALPFAGIFDAVFRSATFHWIPDHDRLFASIHRALKAGGRLVAQCGGAGNLQRLYERARRLRESPRYTEWFGSWSDPWRFEGVGATEARLARAGSPRLTYRWCRRRPCWTAQGIRGVHRVRLPAAPSRPAAGSRTCALRR